MSKCLVCIKWKQTTSVFYFPLVNMFSSVSRLSIKWGSYCSLVKFFNFIVSVSWVIKSIGIGQNFWRMVEDQFFWQIMSHIDHTLSVRFSNTETSSHKRNIQPMLPISSLKNGDRLTLKSNIIHMQLSKIQKTTEFFKSWKTTNKQYKGLTNKTDFKWCNFNWHQLKWYYTNET